MRQDAASTCAKDIKPTKEHGMTYPRCILLLAAIGLVNSVSAAFAGRIEPAFHTETAAWNATHVVLAGEGDEIDGRLKVHESWKGDLKPGDEIEVPELKKFQPDEARKIDRRFTITKEKPEALAEMVTCQRMVLFLVRGEAADGKESPAWRPAMTVGDRPLPMAVSVAWLEGEEALAIQQVMNPGPAVLMPLTETAKEFRAFVARVVANQTELRDIAKEADLAQRAAAYRRHVESKSYFVRNAAFEGLPTCRSAAVPVLQGILQNEALVRLHGYAVAALARTEGIDAVPLLVEIIDGETAFWKETAPELPIGWWNKGLDAKRQQYLHSRYGRIVEALFALDRHPDPRAADAVSRLRALWRSLPQLEDRSGLNQISETCASILKKLGK
jgi:hypothetical protein